MAISLQLSSIQFTLYNCYNEVFDNENILPSFFNNEKATILFSLPIFESSSQY
jgi:hypothetical protein